jgi:NADH-quinone oxidoreductase subunit N
LVLTSVIGLYYYLRIIITLFSTKVSTETMPKTIHPFFHISTYITLVIMAGLLCWLGVFPGIILSSIRAFLLLH